MKIDTRRSLTTPDGVTLRYVDTGSGTPPLLFVHGWSCRIENWMPQIERFSPDYRVVALDLRGHGESDKPDEDYTISAFIKDIAWLVEELGLDRPVIVGHSMGGVIAMNLARRHPEIPAGVVLIDPPLGLPESVLATRDAVLAGLGSPSYHALIDGFAKQFFFNSDSPPSLVTEVIENAKTVPQRVLVTALASTLDAEHDVPGPVPVPSLFIRASTHLASEDALQSRFPGMKVVTVPCAHFVQLERPTETNDLIKRFLEGLE